jgi:CBS domain-containing protein
MVGEICTEPAITASPETTVREAAHRMRSRKVGALVVINGSGTPVGLVTRPRHHGEGCRAGRRPCLGPGGSLVTRKPTVIREDAGILDATKLLSRRGIRRLPVVSKAGKLVGILALDDLLMLLGSELGHIASTLASELGRSRI